MAAEKPPVELTGDEYAPGYVRPTYDEYSFANVTSTVADLLGVSVERTLPADALGEHAEADVSNVLVVLIDGVRYDRWLETDGEMFVRAREHGTLTPLTTVYPSETAAAMTTYQTGRQPVEHGILGWEQYIDELGAVVEALKGRTIDGESLESVIENDGFESFSGGTIHETLDEAGVRSTVVGPRSTQTHPFAPERYAGADCADYINPAEGALEARRALECDDPSFVTLYYHQIDSISHRTGPASPHYEATLHMLSACLERGFADLDPEVAAETLVLFTADHGHVDTGEAAEGLLLTEYEVVNDNLALTPTGEAIPPTGSARNVHLHLRDGTTGIVREALEDLDELDAYIWTRAEAIDANLFGDSEPSDLFRRRCGDLVIVPREDPVWYDRAKFESIGQHGGLHPDEMYVPLTTVSATDLFDS